MNEENNENQQGDQQQATADDQNQPAEQEQTPQDQSQEENQDQSSEAGIPASETQDANAMQARKTDDQSSRGREMSSTNGAGGASRDRPSRRREPSEVFDPGAASRVGLLRLGRHYQEAGSTYGAIYAYTRVLERYPGRGAASAAVEELVLMANDLMDQHKFYTALHIFDLLEELM